MDLANADLYRSAGRYRIWDEFAREDAVIWTPPGISPGGFWSVFSHGSCRRVLSPSSPLTSNYGMMIGFDQEHPDHAAGTMMVASDGELHARLRRLVGPVISRIRAASMSGFVQAQVDSLLAGVRELGQVDVTARIAPYLPAAVVCEILGIPRQDRERLIELTNHAFGEAEEFFDSMTSSEAHGEILYYFSELIAGRKRDPGNDLISVLLMDEHLTERDVLINCDNVLVGGNETTRHAVAACFHAASVAGGLLGAIARDPSMIDLAVEELIRWSSPAMHVLRVATEDFCLGDQQVQKGSAVVAWLPAANRDERVFGQAGRIIPDRHPNKHIAFGHGAHHCIGATLARLEIKTLLGALASRLRSVELAAEPTWMRSNLVQGYLHLDVAMTWS